MILDNFFSQEDRFPASLIVIIVHRKVKDFPVFIVIPVLCSVGSENRVLHGENKAAALFDPFGNATHTALSYDVLGEDVLIAGAGPIGMMAAAIVKFAGARHVVVTDFNQYRLDLAKKLGATRTVNLGQEKLPDVMKEIGMTEGFDVGLEMSGSQAGLHDMIHNMKHGGKIALLGLQRTDATVDLETVIFNGLNLRGIYGRKVWDTWYKMSMMIQAGLDISEVITHHFDIKDFAKGFEAMISGESGKVILDWSHVND